MRSFIPLHDLRTDPPALRHLESVVFCPRPHRSQVDAATRLASTRNARATLARLPRRPDVRREVVGELGTILLGKVYLIADPVEAELHRLSVRGTVDVIADD